MRRVLLFFPAAALLSMPFSTVLADEKLSPASLKSLEKSLSEQKQQRETLKSKLADAKNDLETTQSEMVEIAQSIQANEQTLQTVSDRITDLEAEQNSITTRLESDYGSIAALITALERIRRVPPEALIVRPGAPLQTAQSAMLLQGILPAVNERAAALSASLERLEQIRGVLDMDRQEALNARAALDSKNERLAGMIERRKDLLQSTEQEYSESGKAIARMSQEAKNLRDLLAKVEAEERKREAARIAAAKKAAARREANIATAPPPSAPQPVLPKPGTATLPAAGNMVTAFGERDAIGAVAEGISIRTAPGALVTAPMGGVVKFAGPFKSYNRLVIIEHAGSLHSLVGGMAVANVSVGQTVKSGEPLGNMAGGASSDSGRTLYYELRRNGRPVDPATKLKDLRS